MSIKDPPSRTISPGREVPSGSRLAPDAASGDGKPGRAASLRRWLRDSAIRPSPIPRAHYVLGLRRMDAGRAALALWLVALGPAAMFFSYPYTESVFLLSSVGAFVLMESGHWLLSGLAGMAAAATRFPGLLFAVALGAERAAGNRRWTIYAAMLLTLGGLGAVAFVQWYQMGDPLGFYHARSFWIGPERNPLYLIGSFPKALIEGDPFNAEAIGVPVLLLFAAGAAWVTGRMPIAYGVFAIAQIL